MGFQNDTKLWEEEGRSCGHLADLVSDSNVVTLRSWYSRTQQLWVSHGRVNIEKERTNVENKCLTLRIWGCSGE